jgi:hypothetical protein
MAFYITFFRPFKLIVINLEAALFEIILGGHFIIMYITFIQTSADNVTPILIYDVAAFGAFTILLILDTGRTLYKWCYWRKTGKLPSKKRDYRKKIPVTSDTSSFNLLTDKSPTK